MGSVSQGATSYVASDLGGPDYLYIRYVTLGQFLKGFMRFLAAWVGLSLVGIGLGYVADATKGAIFEHTFLGDLPRVFWIWLALALASWFLRGQTIKFPNVGFVTWLVTALCFGGIMLVGEYLPLWAASPLGWALALIDFGYYMLVEAGKANFRATGSRAQ